MTRPTANTAASWRGLPGTSSAVTATRRSASTTRICAPGTPFLRPAPPPSGPGWGASSATSLWTAGSRAAPPNGAGTAWRCCWGSWMTVCRSPTEPRRRWRTRKSRRSSARQSPESRIIFLRRYWYGQSVADIAAGMNCGEGKVKSSLFRTRKALRTYLEQEEVFL